MDNSKRPAYTIVRGTGEDEDAHYGLTKAEYAAIHVNSAPSIEFMKRFPETYKKEPAHPGSVVDIFANKLIGEGLELAKHLGNRSYAHHIQHHFNIETGKWKQFDEGAVPQEVYDAVNDHVKKVLSYYEEKSEYDINFNIDCEVAWRKRIGEALMDSFK